MAKLNSSNYNPARPKLTPEMLEGTAAILTVTNAEEIDITDPNRKDGFRKALAVNFEETGEATMWPNATMSQTLIQMLGDDTDEWIGKLVPVEARHVRWGGEVHHKVCIIEAREWKDAFKEAEVAYPYKTFVQSASKAAPKKAKKR